MKNLRTFALLFFSVLISASLFTACKKGDDGKNGSNGAAGTAGAAGVAGANGLSGNTMLNGTGIPADTLGVAGDFYLDLNSRLLYGPKTAGGWGSGVSIEGPLGPGGAPGQDAIVSVDSFTITNDNWDGRDIYGFVQQLTLNDIAIWPGMAYVRYNYALTDEMLSTGLVIVDMALSPRIDEFKFTALPFTANAGTFDMNLNFRMSNPLVEISYFYTTNGTNVIPQHSDIQAVELPDYKVKIIAIPATVVSTITRVMKEQKAKVKMN